MATSYVKAKNPQWVKKFYSSKKDKDIVCFDVGACRGKAFIEEVQKYNNLFVYSFEPQKDLFENLNKKTKNIKNYHCIHSAVSNYNGVAKFNVCPDLGCSSLNKFNDNVDKIWKADSPIWKRKRVPQKNAYRYFKYTDSYEVPVTRLDTFIQKVNETSSRKIETIDFLHIDAQGEDLNVLRGLGNFLNRVEAGMIECSKNEDVSLYDNAEDNTREAVQSFLDNNGFTVIFEYPDGGLQYETNLVFKRK